ncbi:ATP-binding protein [Bosea massiliensis]|uniref:ATP-binding protein n=1 Tax=Bosea massiliensis TaxID=151419 RepID=A0ABW0P3T2_9HYPH
MSIEPPPIDPGLRAEINAARDAMGRRLVLTRNFHRIEDAVVRQFNSLTSTRTAAASWGPGNRPPSKAVVISGPFRTGKTWLVNAALASLKPIVAGYIEVSPNPLSVECPSHFEMTGLGRNILDRLQLLPARSLGPTETMERVTRRLGIVRPTQLRIDEFQRTLHPVKVGPLRLDQERLRIWGQIQLLLDDPYWPTPIILTGLPEIITVLEQPRMGFLRDRCETVLALASMTPGDTEDVHELEGGFDQFGDAVGVRAERTRDDELPERLMLASNYAMGLAFELTHRAIENALENRRARFDIEDFAAVYARKTGAEDAANPFLARDWIRVDPKRLLAKDTNQKPAGD